MPTQLNRVARQASLGFFVLVILIFVLAGFMLFDLCKRIDEQQRRHRETDAQRALETRQDKLGRVLTDYSFWIEAYARTEQQVDVDWAYDQDNVGPSLYKNYGVNGAFILAPDGTTRYAVVDGELSQLRLELWLKEDQVTLLAQARERSPAEGYAQGYFLIDGKPASVTAAVIRPDASYQDFKGLSYMVFVDVLTPDKLAALGQVFELDGLTAQPGALPTDGRPTLVVSSDPGIAVTFHWTIQALGHRLLMQFLPLLAGMCGLALLLVGYLRYRIALAARQTERVEEALRYSEQRFRMVSEAASDWIWETDAEQRLVYISERFVAVTGFRQADWLNRPLYELLDYERSQLDEMARTPVVASRIRQALRCEMRDAQTKLRFCQLSAQPIVTGGCLAGFRGTVCDVTEEIEAKARIEHLSQHDALTGLANRHQLHRHLAQRFAEGVSASQPLHLLVLDLDRFKPVNDSLGHAAGDQVLCQVARELRASLREGDLVARIGGDEFVIALSGSLSVEQLTSQCSRILDAISCPIRVGEHDIAIGASLGIARAPEDGHNAEDLLRYADIALYEAKAAGRNTLRFYEPSMNQRILERRQLETELRLGLQRGELELDFQPRFDASSQRLLGAEALVRWNHPVRGRLAPAEFIALAEETGLILGLSDWVLQEACTQAVAWEPELIVSINLSPLEFQRDDLVARVRGVLERTGIAPARVELELTENVLLDDAAGALELMQRLKALGVRLSMDDFGTGYSSLSYLRTYPFDCLKIDRSFVSNIEVSESNAAIVEAIVSMGRALSLTVVAEGIETAGQLARIADLKCDQAQGFHLQRPLSRARFAALRQQALVLDEA
ncbi:bifunctional diguanylate cyclase/phosphodiesterase [Pseudomonas oryzihabitans]|uniref:bifunctional diguanylate cyclase/phosphodiesterase n=1 Tax=Pseudomonas oryzihabitans TaxID=47885 RepID=UPI0011245F86|nr:EAL domain-containing protein [Pseudomonas psychrotolerans]QDD92017.1 bifunctional diguanylate cyclase/phosphodiesterase [Pseudomonas psychrotolerans]